MPNADTFSIKPLGDFVRTHLEHSKISIDPFARNKRWATHTNDLNPKTNADHHLDAEDFCWLLGGRGVKADLVLFDPPYSPRQMIECYASVGELKGPRGGRNGELYARVRNAIASVVELDSIVLSFGWNSTGMGKKHGFEIEEILLCAHGGGHNDTICLRERGKHPSLLSI